MQRDSDTHLAPVDGRDGREDTDHSEHAAANADPRRAGSYADQHDHDAPGSKAHMEDAADNGHGDEQRYHDDRAVAEHDHAHGDERDDDYEQEGDEEGGKPRDDAEGAAGDVSASAAASGTDASAAGSAAAGGEASGMSGWACCKECVSQRPGGGARRGRSGRGRVPCVCLVSN